MAEYYSKSTILNYLRYGISSNSMLMPYHIERMLDCVPIVDVEPVIHGRWVKMGGIMPPECTGHYECSECLWHGINNNYERHYRYCPNCGAKMDGEEGRDA